MTVPPSRRRLVLATLGAMAAARLYAEPRSSRARVGVLLATNRQSTRHLMSAFTARMTERGWVEDRNIEYPVRYAENDARRFGPLARELLAQQLDVLFAPFGPAALAAKKLDRHTPIVFALTTDPVGLGLVADLARPGGNATGVCTRGEELIAKRLQLLNEVAAPVRRIGALIHRELWTARTEMELTELKRAAGALGIEVIIRPYAENEDFGPALEALKRSGAEAVFGMPEQYGRRAQFVAEVARVRLPASYPSADYVHAGGLMALAPSYPDRYRRAADYVDRILRGAKPSELAVEQASTLNLTLNAKAARALGLAIPQSVLLRADEVIE